MYRQQILAAVLQHCRARGECLDCQAFMCVAPRRSNAGRARSNAACAPAGLKALSDEAAAAVELVKCSLLSAERAGTSPAAERARMLARFGEQQLVAAYRLLCEQDQLYVGGISKAYALSDAFKASLQVFPKALLKLYQCCQVHILRRCSLSCPVPLRKMQGRRLSMWQGAEGSCQSGREKLQVSRTLLLKTRLPAWANRIAH